MWHQGADGPEMWDSCPVNWKSPDLNRFEMRFCLDNRVRTPGLSWSFIDACLFAFFNSKAGDVRRMMHQTGSRLIHSLKITTQTSCRDQRLAPHNHCWWQHLEDMSLQCLSFVPKIGAGWGKTLIIPNIPYKNKAGHALASNRPCILVHRCHFQPPPLIRISQLDPVEWKNRQTRFSMNEKGSANIIFQ